MSRNDLIEKTVNALHKLPDNRCEEVADFAEFLLKKTEEQHLRSGAHYIVENSDTFKFPEEEDDLLPLNDLKEKV